MKKITKERFVWIESSLSEYLLFVFHQKPTLLPKHKSINTSTYCVFFAAIWRHIIIINHFCVLFECSQKGSTKGHRNLQSCFFYSEKNTKYSRLSSHECQPLDSVRERKFYQKEQTDDRRVSQPNWPTVGHLCSQICKY